MRIRIVSVDLQAHEMLPDGAAHLRGYPLAMALPIKRNKNSNNNKSANFGSDSCGSQEQHAIGSNYNEPLSFGKSYLFLILHQTRSDSSGLSPDRCGA